MDGRCRAGRQLRQLEHGRTVGTTAENQTDALTREIAREQGVVDVIYDRLDQLRALTRSRLATVRRTGPSGSPQNRSERDAFATLYEDRLAQLEAVEDRLAFGRLDLNDGASRYVGRLGLTDDDHTPLLTDWRAPAAQAFYRATAAHPDGVVRRRHLISAGRRVTGLEDEVLDLDHADASSGTLTGEGALLVALAARRTGRMGDIVATIQAEQDEVIRSSLAGALVVQGGPGTGKTAVALHRAAYLLYAHRRVLERSGVLLVGPSRTFLRYIDQVLPSLGETGVVATTIAELVPGVVVTGTDSPLAATVKGRTAMAEVLARAVHARERVPAHPVHLTLDGHRLVIRPQDVAAAIARARRQHRPHNQARVGFVRDMLNRLAEQYLAQLGPEAQDEDRADVLEDLRTHRDVRVALNLAWMPLTPRGLLADLYAKPWRLAEAGPQLSRAELAALERPREHGWTEADVPLLDELAELLGEDDQAARAQARADAARRSAELEYARQVLASTGSGALVSAETLADRFASSGPALTTAERAAADRSWTYGHVVVDEAQELSAMAWRALLRRVPTRSLTIVGDVAQTASPAGARDWARMLDPLLRGGWRRAELTVNYRNPASVARAAHSAGRAAGLPVGRLTAARDLADALVVHPVSREDLVATAARLADEAVALDSQGAGRVALVAEPALLGGLQAALTARGRDVSLVGPGGVADLAAALTLLSPVQTKGLEFDVVVLVEPEQVLLAGAGDLYVALTRATTALHLVHANPLPAGL